MLQLILYILLRNTNQEHGPAQTHTYFKLHSIMNKWNNFTAGRAGTKFLWNMDLYYKINSGTYIKLTNQSLDTVVTVLKRYIFTLANKIYIL